MNKKIKNIFLIIFTLLMVVPVQKCFASTDVTLTLKTGYYNYDYASEVLELVNEERDNEGLEALVFDSELQEAAMERAKEIAVYFSHTRPNGTDPLKTFPANGENIAAGQSSASSVMESWMNSSGHKENILESSFKSIGIGCFYQSGTIYWVQLFSTSESSSSTIATGVKTEENPIVYANTAYLNSLYLYYYGKSNNFSLNVGDSISTYYTGVVNAGWTSRYASLVSSNFNYTSSDEDVFTVDSNGTINAVGSGVATLTAELGDLNVTREITVYGLSLAGDNVILKSGETFNLNASITPDVSGYTVTYSSSDKNVATVDSSGLITAVGDGTATITITTSTGLVSTCIVTVRDYLMGDMNNNGVIDISDVILLIKAYFNDDYQLIGDMNNNSVIDVSDIILLIKVYFNS